MSYPVGFGALKLKSSVMIRKSSLITHPSSLLVGNDLSHFIVTTKYQPLEGLIQFGYDYAVDAPYL